MTEDIYKRLMTEREVFLKLLEQLRVSIHPAIFVKETMVIFQSNAPAWFKKAISKSLTSMMRSKNGVEHIAVALFDGVSNDSTQTWKILEVFSKIILSCRNFPDFEENICCQLVKILDKVTEETPVFERIFTHCTKTLYQADRELTENIFLKKILSEFSHFTSKDHIFDDGEVVTKYITQNVRLCHALFVENFQDSPSLPLTFLTPSVSVIFRLYAFTLNTSFKSTNNELREILIALLNLNPSGNFQLFDSFLFGISSNDIPPFKNDIILKINQDDIVINHPDHAVSYSSSENSDCILKLDKYFKKANEDLLSLEPEFMSEFFERKLVVYKLLSELAEDKTVQKRITNDPDVIITYINGVLNNTIAASVHKTTNYDTDEFQSIFTTTMILQVLVSSCSKDRLGNYEVLRPALIIILEETSNGELQNLVRDIMEIMAEEKSSKTTESEEVKTELDQAIDDICDPLLPVRGHGLMTLMKLVERKDKCVMERKQYVLNIFQQNLKNDDSFIYLSAIGGLAAMGDVFPDTVLSILCEEYSDTSRQNDDGHEVRMKIGESLVRVTKGLGDMAPKYKSLLLNTFLIGTKDDDHLMRASSLSNLGEICRVLGYKLGTIITEVLVCVHAVIATDKAPEARRAAITVIRQLFVGLDRESLSFLKDDILPIYRTLKAIYTDDRDDVVRLQAQLALEELNENMRNFMFPNPALNMEKKIIVLD
ncbi:hypothetical protein NQ318_020250 [Aromia moschata]|uniref:Uncharacterized protein n=1 Tax=Aromia moschata TaxID=1265417 RepID=A0AAV8ZBJ5_9CUCU|nr:hypothetical protein NQ318_020250 [Aromia moschata]